MLELNQSAISITLKHGEYEAAEDFDLTQQGIARTLIDEQRLNPFEDERYLLHLVMLVQSSCMSQQQPRPLLHDF